MITVDSLFDNIIVYRSVVYMCKNVISIIVPCYNEEEMIPLFYDEIDKISQEMNAITFEFIFVNDGSRDATLDRLKEISAKRQHYMPV